MTIKLAKKAGFCMGVSRAMGAVLGAANLGEGEIRTLGPLVHNHQAIEMLTTRGVEVVDQPTEVKQGTIFIRAHGVSPTIKEELKLSGAKVHDLTCPHVLRAQKIVARHAAMGWSTVIIGDDGHAEVIGLLGHAQGRGHVVASVEDIAALPPMEKICVVAQTTQDSFRFATLSPILAERFPGASIHNTVCAATDDRQNEVRQLCKEVEAMIVVGGKHSANTVRLAEIVEEEGLPVYHIEKANELDPVQIAAHKSLGITAGASTPHWVFREVETRARTIQFQKASPLLNLIRQTIAFFVNSFLYVGAGTAAMTYASLRMLRIEPRWSFLFLASLYVVSILLFHHYQNRDASSLNHPERTHLLQRFRWLFISATVVMPLTCLLLALELGFLPFIIMLFAFSAGLSYKLHLLPDALARRVQFKAFKDIPGSKDFAVALAWATVTVLLPWLTEPSAAPQLLWVVFPFVFLLTFIRSIVYDLKDMEGDRALGRETIPLFLGRKKAVKLVFACNALLGIIAILDVALAWSPLGVFFFLPVFLAVGTYLVLYHRRIISQGTIFEIAVDFPFILAGLVAFTLMRILNLN